MIQPKQMTKESEKDSAWSKGNINYFADMTWGASSHTYGHATIENYELDMLYRAAEGELELEDYRYVLNPYNTENKKYAKRPAKLRNMNIILPIITLFLGERNRKNNEFTVIVTNSDAENKQKKAISEQVRGVLAQSFVNQLNTLGVQTGMPSKDIPSVQDTAKEAEENYNDDRAVFGQEALEYLRFELKLNHKMQLALYHFLVSGRVLSYKGVLKNDVDYDIVHPCELRWFGKPNTGLIEDSDAIVRCQRLTMGQIIAKYNKIFSDEALLEIESKMNSNPSMGLANVGTEVDSNWRKNSFSYVNDGNSIDFYHVTWRTYRKVGYLTFVNPLTGGIETTDVDETYVMQEGDLDIEWDWIAEWREGFRADDNIFPDKGEFAENLSRVGVTQRDELNNNATCKLPYNGTIYTFPSLVKQGVSYQALYNIFYFRFELTMARNKDKIMTFPIGLIPEKEGWNEDTWIYYAENTGYGFYDETKPNANAAIQGMKVQDMSLGQYASQMREVLVGIKDDWWDSIGMNRQRYGDTNSSDGKGVNEQAIFRSSVISDELYRQFRVFEESELQGLLDVSKMAWINGKKGTYINSDKKVAFFSVEPVEHVEADYGVFAIIDEKEERKLQQYEQLAQPMLQNAVTAPVAAEMLNAGSTAKARQILKKGWEIQRKFEEEQAQKDRDTQVQISENQKAAVESANEMKKYEVDEKNRTVVEVAYIKAQSDIAGASTIKSGEVDVNTILDEMDANLAELSKNNVTNIRNAFQQRQAENASANQSRALNQKAVSDEIKLKIAKENKNKYDK